MTATEPLGFTQDDDKARRRIGWRVIRDALRPHRKWSRIGIAAGAGWAAARVVIPLLAAAAIDRSIDHTRDPLWTWIAFLVGAGVFQGLCTGMRRYAAFCLAYRVETDMRMQLVAHLQRLHFAYHDGAQTGQLMANAASDLNQVNQKVVLIPLTIASTIMMVAVIVVLVIISPGLASSRYRAAVPAAVGGPVLAADVPDRHVAAERAPATPVPSRRASPASAS